MWSLACRMVNSPKWKIDAASTAVAEDRAHFVNESADLLFHLLVLLKSRDVALGEVEAALGERTRMSGLQEKASRPSD